MDDLKAFWAQGNKIEVIPATIGSLRLLTQLRLFKNRLRFMLGPVAFFLAIDYDSSFHCVRKKHDVGLSTDGCRQR